MKEFVGYILFFGVLLGSILLFGIVSDIGYKYGQIDAINGVIKYELIVQPNYEVEWKKIKGEGEGE